MPRDIPKCSDWFCWSRHSAFVSFGWPRLAAWKDTGRLEVFHYGEGREISLAYSFLEDAGRFDPFPKVSQPTLIFHGERDNMVPVEQSLAFLRANPHAKLVRFHESGHELTDVLENMWLESKDFLLPRNAQFSFR
jgi:uncharacterized protein